MGSLIHLLRFHVFVLGDDDWNKLFLFVVTTEDFSAHRDAFGDGTCGHWFHLRQLADIFFAL